MLSFWAGRTVPELGQVCWLSVKETARYGLIVVGELYLRC